MQERLNLLKEKTKKAIVQTSEAIQLFSNDEKSTRADAIAHDLERERILLQRINNAVSKRSSIAIYGQSQVGKSFLVQNLAKSPKTSKLEIINAGTAQPLDFLQKINPPGGRESTGIITRFSTVASAHYDAQFPYQVELLSQLDIAAIICNAYVEDIDYSVDEHEVSITIEKLFAAVNSYTENQEDLQAYEVLEFVDYLSTELEKCPLILQLKHAGYFELLSQALLKVPCIERYRFLEPLWIQNEFLTKVFKKLSETIESIEHSRVALLDEKAIINGKPDARFSNTTNILDVERVKELFQEDQLPQLKVKTSNGKQVSTSLSALSCLIKELHLHIPDDFNSDAPQKFLKHSDLLDFPGSRVGIP